MHTNETPIGQIRPGQGETILAVDDDEALLPAIVDLLTLIGYRMITADNGQTAVETYRRNRPDAVLMDRNMPCMNGVEAARQVLEFDPEAKVVLLSGFDASGYDGIEPRLLKQIKAYLTKPIQIKELSQILSGVING